MTMHSTNYENTNQTKRPLPIIASQRSVSYGPYRHTFKPCLDKLLIILAVPLVLPVLVVIALLAMLDGGKPFYTQLRVGRGGKTFRMWKIRTMVDNADTQLKTYLAANPAARAEWGATQKLKNDPRITPIGHILRKTSLDELPQLFNVLTGSMSLVGPRPMMLEQKQLYLGQTYFQLSPGITGLWQISDRNDSNFVDRVRHDDIYGRTVSLITDLRILFKTVAVVLRGTGC
jgi:exopolysaccharide production protein ExoY